MSAPMLCTERDGSLVVNGVVVFSPCAEFTAEQIRAVVDGYSARLAQVSDLQQKLNAEIARRDSKSPFPR